MTAPARTAAYRALRAVDRGELDLPAALADSRRRLADDRDRALAAEIATGTLRWQRALDHVIASAADRPLEKIDADVRRVLRLSAYQLLHLDRVPASAVVDDAVDLTRAARKTSAAGFVNAVLRRIVRNRHRVTLPSRPDDTDRLDAALDYLGVTWSHPEWLVARWVARHGFPATERWVQFDNETPLLTLRANTLRTSRDALARDLAEQGVLTEPTRYAPEGLVVTGGHLPLAEGEDRFALQDEASQLVALAVGARPGERVLDLCASPGGKTTAIAESMGDTGALIACDVRSRRVGLLRRTVGAWRTRHTHIVHVASSGALPFRCAFDRVIVDAPCSGLGTIRRDPDIRWRRHEDELPLFAALQRVLLERAAAAVASGGRLVYATCSSEAEENEEVVAAFASDHSEFERVDLREEAILAPVVDESGALRTWPFAHSLEAFFAAALVRR